jgi:hypothetical protein
MRRTPKLRPSKWLLLYLRRGLLAYISMWALPTGSEMENWKFLLLIYMINVLECCCYQCLYQISHEARAHCDCGQ